MNETFDAYHKWLGIRPEDQPPNHYRLLGIAWFEDDLDVIEAAADGRMAHLRTYQIGQRARLCQRLLNEVSAARLVLVDPARRAAYDEWLRQSTAPPPSAPPAAPPPVTTPPVPAKTPFSPRLRRTRRRKKSEPVIAWTLIALSAIGMAVVVLVVIVKFLA